MRKFLMKAAPYIILLIGVILGFTNTVPDYAAMPIGTLIGMGSFVSLYIHEEYFNRENDDDDNLPQHPAPSV